MQGGFVISDIVFGCDNSTYKPSPVQELSLLTQFSGITTLQSLVSEKQCKGTWAITVLSMRIDNLTHNPSPSTYLPINWVLGTCNTCVRLQTTPESQVLASQLIIRWCFVCLFLFLFVFCFVFLVLLFLVIWFVCLFCFILLSFYSSYFTFFVVVIFWFVSWFPFMSVICFIVSLVIFSNCS